MGGGLKTRAPPPIGTLQTTNEVAVPALMGGSWFSLSAAITMKAIKPAEMSNTAVPVRV